MKQINLSELQAALKRVKFHGMRFSISRADHDVYEASLDRYYFVIWHNVLDAETLKPVEIVTKVMVANYEFREESDFFKWVWYQIRKRVMHEAAEFFIVDGIRPHDPHSKNT